MSLACFQARHPSPLLSLLDVKALPLSDLLGIWNAFNDAFVTWSHGPTKDKEFLEKLKVGCVYLREMCAYLEMSDDLLFQIGQVEKLCDKPTELDRQVPLYMAASLLSTVMHVLDRPRFKAIASDKLDYFEQPRKEFGEDTIAKFQPVGSDVEEAGKCYAAGRDTACVFHLMRVMEVGLRALGSSLNDPRLDPKRNPSWDSILKKCDEELGKALKDRAVEWRDDDAFYSTATANLRAVKDAWRNPTMHVENLH